MDIAIIGLHQCGKTTLFNTLNRGIDGKYRNILQGADAFLLAAGTIHSYFHRGFVRAEVIPFDDLVRCGSIAQGRKEGVLRSEGKTYQVKDGDVIHFLVNV